jgi:hypothetical protein
MHIYELTVERLQTGNQATMTVRADSLDQAHYKAICKFGTDIALINCRELKS